MPGDKGLEVKKELSVEEIDLIRKTVAKDATDLELKMLFHISKEYSLDPILKEIMFIKRRVWNPYKNDRQGGFDEIPTYLVGRDGFLAIAHRSGQFGGIKSWPTFHQDGHLIFATCQVWNKTCPEPIEVTVYLEEYEMKGKDGKPQALWATKPITMLTKVAEAQALRKAFNVKGVYVQEEFDAELRGDNKNELENLKTDLQISEALNNQGPKSAEEQAVELLTKILDEIAECKTDKDLWQVRKKYQLDIGRLLDKDREYILEEFDHALERIVKDQKKPEGGQVATAPILVPGTGKVSGKSTEAPADPKKKRTAPRQPGDEDLNARDAFSKEYCKKAVDELNEITEKNALNVWKEKNAPEILKLLPEYKDYIKAYLKTRYEKIGG